MAIITTLEKHHPKVVSCMAQLETSEEERGYFEVKIQS